MNTDKIKQHIIELRNKHTKIQTQINEAIYTNRPDEEVNVLKKEKLRIKDEIRHFERKLDQTIQ